MRVSHVKAGIQSKFESLIGSIRDKKIADLMRQNLFLAGGCIASLFLDEKVSDYDFYFKDKNVIKPVLEYYIKKSRLTNIELSDDSEVFKLFIKSSGMAKVEKTSHLPEFSPVCFTDNAVTLTGGVQLVFRFFGEPAEIIGNFDFVHTTNYWSAWNNELVTNEDATLCVLTKELVYQGSLYPISSLIRIKKFIERGWYISAGNILKISLQASKLDMADYSVLKDQLLGVDMFYFRDLLEVLDTRNKAGFEVSSEYLLELIDNYF